jgi:hypothetical protein
MAKKVQVTSVTPAIKVKAISKAKQASTRKAIGVAVGGLPAVAAMAIMNRKKDSKKPTSKEIAERTRMVAKVKRTAELVAPVAKPKAKGLNDYLDKGMTPPSKNKKLPSDADVILKGYNDKKTIAKLKESKKKGKK